MWKTQTILNLRYATFKLQLLTPLNIFEHFCIHELIHPGNWSFTIIVFWSTFTGLKY